MIFKLTQLLAALMGAHTRYLVAHWTATGPNYYGDHLLMERLYDSLPEDIDKLAEMLTARTNDAETSLDSVSLSTKALEFLKDHGQELIPMEKVIQDQINDLVQSLTETKDQALLDFLTALASNRDTALYLLGQRSKAGRLASRYTSQTKRAAIMQVGDTVETEFLRMHLYRGSLEITLLENAGKRGKTVDRYSIISDPFGGNVDAIMEYIPALHKAKNDSDLANIFADVKEAGVRLVKNTPSKGVDVTPAGFKPIEINTKEVSIRAGYKDFRIRDNKDSYNEPTCIPAIRGGKADIKVFYRWVKDNEQRLQSMTYRDVLGEMRKLGIKYHSYCAMD